MDEMDREANEAMKYAMTDKKALDKIKEQLDNLKCSNVYTNIKIATVTVNTVFRIPY